MSNFAALTVAAILTTAATLPPIRGKSWRGWPPKAPIFGGPGVDYGLFITPCGEVEYTNPRPGVWEHPPAVWGDGVGSPDVGGVPKVPSSRRGEVAAIAALERGGRRYGSRVVRAPQEVQNPVEGVARRKAILAAQAFYDAYGDAEVPYWGGNV